MLERIKLFAKPAPEGDRFVPETVLNNCKHIKRVLTLLLNSDSVAEEVKTKISDFMSPLNDLIKEFTTLAQQYNRSEKVRRGKDKSSEPKFLEFIETTKHTIYEDFKTLEEHIASNSKKKEEKN